MNYAYFFPPPRCSPLYADDTLVCPLNLPPRGCVASARPPYQNKAAPTSSSRAPSASLRRERVCVCPPQFVLAYRQVGHHHLGKQFLESRINYSFAQVLRVPSSPHPARKRTLLASKKHFLRFLRPLNRRGHGCAPVSKMASWGEEATTLGPFLFSHSHKHDINQRDCMHACNNKQGRRQR